MLVDQMVPDALSRFLREKGHDVDLVREVLTPTAPDLDIARLANQIGAIVITWNVKHFDRFLTRAPRGENIRFRKAGLIGVKCPEGRALARFEQVLPVIDFEYAHLQGLPDKRMFVTVEQSQIHIFR